MLVMQGRDQVRYSVKCSFLEIYNETITDLLKPSSGNLNLREDMKRGCYVDNLTEQVVLNGMLTTRLSKPQIQDFELVSQPFWHM
jgi:hypothetical protein